MKQNLLSLRPWRRAFPNVFLQLLLAVLLVSGATARTPALVITTTSLSAATVGVFYSQTLTATGGMPPYTWSGGGGLPTGLTLNAATGVISGMATASGSWVYSYPFRPYITVKDANNASAPPPSPSWCFLHRAQTIPSRL